AGPSIGDRSADPLASAGARFGAGRGAGLHRDVDLHRGLGRGLRRGDEAAGHLERRCAAGFHRCLAALDGGGDVLTHAFESALHAHRHLQQGGQVLLEGRLQLACRLGVRAAFDARADLRRDALDLAAHLSVAVCLALRAHLRRLHFAAALRLLELDVAAARAHARAGALGLHRAAGVTAALASALAARLGFARALAVANAGALGALDVLAVALAGALAVALAADLALALAAARSTAAAFTLGAGLDGALALALAFTLAADLAAFALDLGLPRLHVRGALPGALGHRVHRGVTLGRDHLDLELTLRLGLHVSNGLDGRLASGLRLLAGPLLFRLDIGGTEILGELAAGHGHLPFDLCRQALQVRPRGQGALHLAFDLSVEAEVCVEHGGGIRDVRRTTRAGDARHTRHPLATAVHQQRDQTQRRCARHRPTT